MNTQQVLDALAGYKRRAVAPDPVVEQLKKCREDASQVGRLLEQVVREARTPVTLRHVLPPGLTLPPFA